MSWQLTFFWFCWCSKLRNYWDFIVILLVVYTSLVLPMRTAFLWVYDEAGSSINGWTITDITIDFLFLLDVVMNFNTGYIREPDFVSFLPDASLRADDPRCRSHILRAHFIYLSGVFR